MRKVKVEVEVEGGRFRMVNGRQVWSEMPDGHWFIEDQGGERCIYVGQGIGYSWMSLYRKGGTLGRVLSAGSHRVVSKNLPVVAFRETALRNLWDWVKGQQCPMMKVHQGTLPEGHCCPRIRL